MDFVVDSFLDASVDLLDEHKYIEFYLEAYDTLSNEQFSELNDILEKIDIDVDAIRTPFLIVKVREAIDDWLTDSFIVGKMIVPSFERRYMQSTCGLSSAQFGKFLKEHNKEWPEAIIFYDSSGYWIIEKPIEV